MSSGASSSSSSSSSFAFGANERSEATRGGFEDRERFCFRWSRGFGKLEEGSRLVSICISLFLFGCYFFLSLIHRVAKIFICTREKKEFLDGIFFVRRLTQRRMMHLFLLSVVVFRAKPFETNARREVRNSGEEKRLRAFTRVRFQVLVSKN